MGDFYGKFQKLEDGVFPIPFLRRGDHISLKVCVKAWAGLDINHALDEHILNIEQWKGTRISKEFEEPFPAVGTPAKVFIKASEQTEQFLFSFTLPDGNTGALTPPSLLPAASPNLQSEDVEMDRRGPAEPCTRLGDGLQHDTRLGDAQPRAAVLLGHGDSQPAIARYCSNEVIGKPCTAVKF